METEKAVVKKIEGEYIILESAPISSCSNCSSSGFCSIGKNKKKRVIKARNSKHLELKVGDIVKYHVEEVNVVLISLFIYFFPVISLVTGAVLGINYLNIFQTDKELNGVFLAFIFLMLSFLIIKFISPILDKKKLLYAEIIDLCDKSQN